MCGADPGIKTYLDLPMIAGRPAPKLAGRCGDSRRCPDHRSGRHRRRRRCRPHEIPAG
ncbi:hypothetical protein I553_4545 [Mycobacterium xenopi 4042]|uniref:Uncharacterized protein n=1 Tax=Mycobacterium xenopi 4042 TaxID=1299334 RepID=X8AH17_MYCXE|nr:hypothetical protein I553_4545 [Mycobacterium xenopi 4042]